MKKSAVQRATWPDRIARAVVIIAAVAVTAAPAALALPIGAQIGGTLEPTGGTPAPSPEPAGPPTSSPDLAVVPTPTPGSPGPGVSPSPTPPILGPGVPTGPVTTPGTVPILYYHRVQSAPPEFRDWSKAKRRQFLTYNVLPAAFEAQLDWLQVRGYTTILPRDLAAHWDHGTALPARPVIITFDDGSYDWLRTVLPALKSRGMVAEFYLTLDAIKHGNVRWQGVRRLIKAGNGIGAHNVHHVQLAGLRGSRPAVKAKKMWAEVNDARTIIGENTGVYPDSMAYVGGGYDDRLIELVERAGYTTARGIDRGITQQRNRRFRLRVVRIGVRDDVVHLQRGVIDPLLPTFTARMAGVSDKPT